MICIACENEHQENFCPNCGERAGIKKITFNSILADAFSTITNMDKGFLFNLKHLTLAPKQLIDNYLSGKRKGIYNPISFLIISTTIYIVADIFKVPVEENVKDPSKIYTTGYEAGQFLKTNLKFFWISAIIWLATSIKIMFSKNNLAEHLAISSFIIGYATLIGLIGLIILKWPIIFNPFVYGTILVTIYRIFKNEKDKFGSFIQALVAVILFLFQLSLIIVTIGIIRTQIL